MTARRPDARPMKHRKDMLPKVCAGCMEQFEIRANEDPWRYSGRRFCSRACSDARGERDLEGKRAFFMSRALPEPNSGCWLWTGSLTKGGYAMFSCGPDKRRAARAAYSLFCEEISEGLMIRHACDTPLCVNPDHLLPGTAQQNSDDMVARGRRLLGSKSHNAKLTEAQVIAILASKAKQKDLAVRYGVSKATISLIKSGKHWAHINFDGKCPEFEPRRFTAEETAS